MELAAGETVTEPEDVWPPRSTGPPGMAVRETAAAPGADQAMVVLWPASMAAGSAVSSTSPAAAPTRTETTAESEAPRALRAVSTKSESSVMATSTVPLLPDTPDTEPSFSSSIFTEVAFATAQVRVMRVPTGTALCEAVKAVIDGAGSSTSGAGTSGQPRSSVEANRPKVSRERRELFMVVVSVLREPG